MRIDRRAFTSALLLVLAFAQPAEARCARVDPVVEARRSTYVVEAVLESVDDGVGTFLVTAIWSGQPPTRLRAEFSGGRRTLSSSDVGRSWLVFAFTRSDGGLAMGRCGSSGPLPATEAVSALAAAGFTRVAR